MLCSISTSTSGKSGTTNWLDRLRSSKGFPTAPENFDLDLDHDHVLLPNASSDSPTNDHPELLTRTQHKRVANSAAAAASSSGRRNEDAVMSDILSDLFNIGEKIPGFSGKKSAGRKQTNPKFCSASTTGENCSDSCVRNDENAQAKTPSFNNSDNHSKNCGDDEDDVEETEEGSGGGGGDRELKGYSRSEVTVIDTSCEVWKLDKLVFRRKNVWKVRDKTGKPWTRRTKKKRKPNQLHLENAKKKPKLSNNTSEDEKREEVCTETLDSLTAVPKNRFQLSRSPRKLEKSASVVLIKAIPTTKKSGRTPPKNHLKGT